MNNPLANKTRLSNGRLAKIGTPDVVMPTVRERFESFYERGNPNECWNWKSAKVYSGYGVIWVNGGNAFAHRLAYEYAFGPFADDLCVLHRCDNPSCVNPSHLFLGTRGDNIRDASMKGRLRFGAENHNSKLTVDSVREARRLHTDRFSIRQLALMYGVNWKTMQYAIFKKTWRSA